MFTETLGSFTVGKRVSARAILLAGACLILAPSGSHAETALTTTESIAGIDAYGGKVVYSQKNKTDGSYQLMQLPGVPVPGVAPSTGIPFEVDLGPGQDGGVVAVYPRCSTQTAVGQRTGCDIYRYDFQTGKEEVLKQIGAPNTDEIAPTVWKSRVAFTQVNPGKSTRIVLSELRPTGARQKTVPKTAVIDVANFNDGDGPLKDKRFHSETPLQLDLNDALLASKWRYKEDTKFYTKGLESEAVSLSKINWKNLLVTASARVARIGSGMTEKQLHAVSLTSNAIYYEKAYGGDESGGSPSYVRHDLKTGQIATYKQPIYFNNTCRLGSTVVEWLTGSARHCGNNFAQDDAVTYQILRDPQAIPIQGGSVKTTTLLRTEDQFSATGKPKPIVFKALGKRKKH